MHVLLHLDMRVRIMSSKLVVISIPKNPGDVGLYFGEGEATSLFPFCTNQP